MPVLDAHLTAPDASHRQIGLRRGRRPEAVWQHMTAHACVVDGASSCGGRNACGELCGRDVTRRMNVAGSPSASDAGFKSRTRSAGLGHHANSRSRALRQPPGRRLQTKDALKDGGAGPS